MARMMTALTRNESMKINSFLWGLRSAASGGLERGGHDFEPLLRKLRTVSKLDLPLSGKPLSGISPLSPRVGSASAPGNEVFLCGGGR